MTQTPKTRQTAAPPAKQTLAEQVRAAQQVVRTAEVMRDDVVRKALAEGLGVRTAAEALEWDPTTVQRRYGGHRRKS